MTTNTNFLDNKDLGLIPDIGVPSGIPTGVGPEPGTPDWYCEISASKVGAIFNKSKFNNAYKLWHQMAGRMPQEKTTDVMQRGHDMEPVVVQKFLRLFPDADMAEQLYFHHGGWSSARPDLYGTLNKEGRTAAADCKTRRDYDGWQHPDNEDFAPLDRVPKYIGLQMIWQMWLTGADVGYVAVLGPHIDAFEVYEIPKDPHMERYVATRCLEFYNSLKLDAPPPMDNTDFTLETVRKTHKDYLKGTEVVIPVPAAMEYITALQAFEDAKSRMTGLKSALVKDMGSANLATMGDNLRPFMRRTVDKNGVVTIKNLVDYQVPDRMWENVSDQDVYADIPDDEVF